MDAVDLGFFRHQGHLTVNGVFSAAEADAVVADIDAWAEAFLAALPKDQRAWYVDRGVQARTVLRKLDNPHVHRPAVRELARDPRLVARVEQILGAGISVYFSQIFFKPPEGGGPKPAHQDNFYFGPTDIDGVVTAWIALDDATLENGCLYFGDGSNVGPVYPHFAPEGEPFNLQLPAAVLGGQPMTPAPVKKGGVSFHHGNTFHQS
ncbi:MAG TPA: phytanoyl-CoA dioxygenase family protein, partial [Caldimonas sp.]